MTHIAAIVLLILAWHTDDDDRYERMARRAAMIGGVAALLNLASQYVVLFGPDLRTMSWGFVVMLLLTAVSPGLIIGGAILIFQGRNIGLKLMAIGLGLWVLTTVLGYASVILGVFN